MIGYLKGKVLAVDAAEVIIDVAGVGYQLRVSLTTANEFKIGTLTELWVHTHVREGVFALYGFRTPQEKSTFLLILGVSGIGPRLALNVFSLLTPDQFVMAVAQEDVAALTAIPGIGKKTAERIVVDLRDKIAQLPAATSAEQNQPELPAQATAALVALGFDRALAQRTALAIRDAGEGGSDVRSWVTAALSRLQKKK